MHPILYEATETGFTSNGLGRLRDCLTCTVTEERNGVFECEFTYPIDGANFDLIQPGRIIGVRHDDTDDIQPFDIVSYSKPISGIVTFHAVHISYRQSGMVATGTNINSLADAFTMLEGAEPENPFTYEADFASTAYMASADGVPRSVRQYLGGIEGSILDTYSPIEYEWDKWRVIAHRQRGTDRSLTIRYGVNLINYKDETNAQGTYSACVPFWKGSDGVGGEVVVRGSRVDSGLSTVSGRNDCVPLDLTEKFEDKPTSAQLESMASSYMLTHQTNIPAQNITVDFVRLQDMGYEDLGSLLQCQLCDTIGVIFPAYNMQGRFKIVKTVFDVLADKFESMELGALSTSLADALGISNSLGGSSSSSSAGIDYIVEEGGSGVHTSWYYRKWASGILECWCRKEYSGVSISSSYGQLKYATLAGFADYPVQFYYNPVVTVTGSVTNGNGWVVQNNSNYSTTNVGGLVVYAPANISSTGVTVNVYAIGMYEAGSITPNVEITQQGDILSMI